MNVRIEDVEFGQGESYSVRLDESSQIIVKDLKIVDSKRGLKVTDSSDVLVSGVNITFFEREWEFGIGIYRSNGIEIIGCNIQSRNGGIVIKECSATYVIDCLVTQTKTQSIVIDSSEGIMLSNNTMDGGGIDLRGSGIA